MINFKKQFIFVGITLLIILSIIYFYPRKLNSEYSGVMYRIGDRNYTENIRIRIDGYYSKRLFKGDNFQGTITIGEKQLSKIDTNFNGYGRGLLFCYNEEKGDYMSYGDIFINNKMGEFSICVLEEDSSDNGGNHWSAQDGLMISAPANSRDEAVKLSNRLMKDVLRNKVQIR